ncbi:Uncharacterised protein [Budvicia aquatica]|uniref:Uncharacterized protein n=1 Tax=Budvicia aquatica TaxID=82979 RepID=A0A484ZJZ8_9GAMM|nr:Uncharacterised protein [Budvicia aquatica]
MSSKEQNIPNEQVSEETLMISSKWKALNRPQRLM